MDSIIVTGAHRDIGLALSRQFVNSGRRVIASCRDRVKAKTLNKRAKTNNPQICQPGLTDNHSIAGFCCAISGTIIDVLVNSAGEMSLVNNPGIEHGGRFWELERRGTPMLNGHLRHPNLQAVSRGKI